MRIRYDTKKLLIDLLIDINIPVGTTESFVHVTPTSSKCPQLFIPHPRCLHSIKEFSSPRHFKLSSHILTLSLTTPYTTAGERILTARLWLSIRHTTSASRRSKWSLQTVPHSLLPESLTSTRPSKKDFRFPFTRRISIPIRAEIKRYNQPEMSLNEFYTHKRTVSGYEVCERFEPRSQAGVTRIWSVLRIWVEMIEDDVWNADYEMQLWHRSM